MISLWLCKRACIHVHSFPCAYGCAWLHMIHVVIGMSRWVAVQALCTQGCGSHLRTTCLVTMAKHAAAKEAKEAQPSCSLKV